MFGVSLTELVVIGLVALLFLGPERLTVAAVSLGKISGQLKRQYDSFLRELRDSVPPATNPAGGQPPEATLLADIRQDLATLEREFRSADQLHPNCPDTPAALARLEAQRALEPNSVTPNPATELSPEISRRVTEDNTG